MASQEPSDSSAAVVGSPYKPLNQSRNEIRVLSLLPTNDCTSPEDVVEKGTTGLVRCTIETVSLQDIVPHYESFTSEIRPISRRNSDKLWHDYADELHHKPRSQVPALPYPSRPARTHERYHRFSWGDYGALSYTWGEQTTKVPIVLNDRIMHVGSNLEAALRALSQDPDYADGLKLWVDAICINQRDIQERNNQVKRMGDIFGGSLIVSIWIGNVLPEQKEGIELIHECVLRSTDDKEAYEAVQELILAGGDARKMKLATDAIDLLTQAPYWSRVWVIQEKCLGPFNPQILFGGFRFKLMSFHYFLTTASNTRGLLRTRMRVWRINKLVELVLLVQERGLETERKRDTGTGKTERGMEKVGSLAVTPKQLRADAEILSLLMMLGRLANAVDLRDKLYGLLGMIPDYVSQHITPDYTKPVDQVFSDYAAALVAGFGHFNFVLTGSSETGLNIPSWVPDLTDTWDPYLWGMGCRASADKKPQIITEDGGLVLVAKGFQVDVVDVTAPCIGWKHGELEILEPGVQPSSYRASSDHDDVIKSMKTAIIRTLHRDADWDCTTGTTVLDIPWLPTLDEASPRIRNMRSRGWGPVLAHSNIVDFTKLCSMLDEQAFRPWGRQFRSFFRNHDTDDDAEVPECSDPEGFLRSLDKHVGIVYPIIMTKRGLFGTVIRPVRTGDVVFVVEGCDAVVVLRPASETGAYRVVSQCYIEGFMKGEGLDMVKTGEVEVRDVRLV